MTKISGPHGPALPGPDLSGSEQSATRVQSGEKSLAHVAQRLKLDPSHLAKANPHIAAGAELKAGQEIRLPQRAHAEASHLEVEADHSTAGPLSAKGELHLRADALKGALHHAGGRLDPQQRPADSSQIPHLPPDLGGGAPLDIVLGPAWQVAIPPRPTREPSPPPPPDDLQARDQVGAPSRSGVNADSEEPEEIVEAYPTPDGQGTYTGPPTRSRTQPGIGLHQQPVAAPIQHTPGEPLPSGDEIPDPGVLHIPREPKPRPSVQPGFDLGAARMESPSGPHIPRPNESVGGQNNPPSPPPPPDDEIIG